VHLRRALVFEFGATIRTHALRLRLSHVPQESKTRLQVWSVIRFSITVTTPQAVLCSWIASTSFPPVPRFEYPRFRTVGTMETVIAMSCQPGLELRGVRTGTRTTSRNSRSSKIEICWLCGIVNPGSKEQLSTKPSLHQESSVNS